MEVTRCKCMWQDARFISKYIKSTKRDLNASLQLPQVKIGVEDNLEVLLQNPTNPHKKSFSFEICQKQNESTASTKVVF